MPAAAKARHARMRNAALDQGDPKASILEFVRRESEGAFATSDKVQQVLDTWDGSHEYPGFTLARQFHVVSQLIRAELGIRIFFTELGGGGLGGFDNHANQRDNHAALLREFSASLTAFVADLRQADLLDRVVVMTFSEFGRTVSENGRRGTGHGEAAPILMAGGRLRGGLIGSHPDLTDLAGDAPRFHTDFRSVFATVLDQWLGFDSSQVFDGQYEALDLFT
jgi:uncharacterized protein (DUF1501 family)